MPSTHMDIGAAASLAPPVYPVILCGGAGTRLWPLSRRHYPKQLLPLVSERTMFQDTVLRTAANSAFRQPVIICNHEHRFLLEEQLIEIAVTPRRIILEPEGLNTAPAVAVAALAIQQMDPAALMMVQPADHLIADLTAFHDAVATATACASTGRLVTFGIPPHRPETGYGYIETIGDNGAGEGPCAISRFVEKPDRATAERFLADGGYLWNSGMFLFPTGLLVEELERFEPRLIDACRRALDSGIEDLDFFRLDRAAFADSPTISIDHALMERTQLGSVVPVAMGWSDIGSWRSLRDARANGDDGNILDGDIIVEDVRNCFIRSNGHLVAAMGVDDLIIVATDDALLVTAADRAADVGSLVERLNRGNRPEPLHHRRVFRPWGSYQTVDAGERFQVKRITVKPAARLSLQMHHHRAEHWVIVRGTAKVTRDNETLLLRENESIYIPLGTTHRLENPGKVPLELIEVQSGAYLGEDDIVRFEDNYGRDQ